MLEQVGHRIRIPWESYQITLEILGEYREHLMGIHWKSYQNPQVIQSEDTKNCENPHDVVSEYVGRPIRIHRESYQTT